MLLPLPLLAQPWDNLFVPETVDKALSEVHVDLLCMPVDVLAGITGYPS